VPIVPELPVTSIFFYHTETVCAAFIKLLSGAEQASITLIKVI